MPTTNLTAEQQEQLEHYRTIYSDFHKEAYGFRPRGVLYQQSRDWTLEEWEVEWTRLGDMCEENRRAEEIAESHAIAEFESLVYACIQLGAADRSAAIRWIRQAENADGQGNNYLCYCLGVPYGYIS